MLSDDQPCGNAVGEILSGLDRLGIAENTLVVFVALAEKKEFDPFLKLANEDHALVKFEEKAPICDQARRRRIGKNKIPVTGIIGQEATPGRGNEFGQYYQLRGELRGPNGQTLSVQTIWMKEHLSGVTKFVTLLPDKEKS